jgi:predicted ArsR family transcriptional regulator
LPAALAAASALAHPARRRIAQLLAGAPGGLTVAEIVRQLGDLHHNAIRNHLRVLARAGAVAVERDPRSGRGRPTERFSLADPEATRIAAQQELTRFLVAMLVEAGAEDHTAREFGRRQGARLVDVHGRNDVMGSPSRLGFAPHETTTAGEAAAGVLEMRLDHCPFRDAVLARGGTLVCELHHGLMEGMAEAAGPEARVSRFEAEDRRRAGCMVRLEGLTAPPGHAAAPEGGSSDVP